MTANADRNFILQQGLEAPGPTSCAPVSSALRFQPRLVGLIIVAGTISRSPAVFAVLAALLWWSALFPQWNPFDFVHNRTLGRGSGTPALGRAPMPRRFAQGMAGALAAAIAAAMVSGLWVLAWSLMALLSLAVAALVLGRFCLGSFIYHLVRGQVTFAIDTLPWRRGA